MSQKKNILHTSRRKTRSVFIGNMGLGGNFPIRIQSMITASLRDVESATREITALAQAGCEIVRFTVPTKEDLKNIPQVRKYLQQKGVRVPLVADIHFTPSIAYDVVPFVEKVRINPGNFIDKKIFKSIEHTDTEYQKELDKIEEKFIPLLDRCREHGVAIRIGTNHGSLSDRIMSRYGDSPEGMVASAMEFVLMAVKNNFHDLVLSMKSSNTQVMISAYRLLAKTLDAQGLNYPFHLGVTEAGNAEDGRIKSAVGIGTLLEEGIGDTIRVSLTEDAINEIPVAYALAAPYNKLWTLPVQAETTRQDSRDIRSYQREKSTRQQIGPMNCGNNLPVRVWTTLKKNQDWDLLEQANLPLYRFEGIEVAAENYTTEIASHILKNKYALSFVAQDCAALLACTEAHKHTLQINTPELPKELIPFLRHCIKEKKHVEFCLNQNQLDSNALSAVTNAILQQTQKSNFDAMSFGLVSTCPGQAYRFLHQSLKQNSCFAPIHLRYYETANTVLTDASAQIGSLLIDGIGDNLQIQSSFSYKEELNLAYSLLQACRVRISKTEYITCPSCGRTQFNLQDVCAKIKANTQHLKGLKIGVMGCIVNGPGEMADADFGYVGTGVGKVSLYVGQNCVERNIPEDQAISRLIDLIKQHGRWEAP